MPKCRSVRGHQIGWRPTREEPEPKPAVPVMIDALCPNCGDPMLGHLPGEPDVVCIACDWSTAYQESMPIREIGHPPLVYYMRMSTLVKIGTTKDLRTRLSTIGAQGVLAVEFGDARLERIRHEQFAPLHSHRREWFHLRDELVDHVVSLRAAFDREHGEPVDQWIRRHLRNAEPTTALAG